MKYFCRSMGLFKLRVGGGCHSCTLTKVCCLSECRELLVGKGGGHPKPALPCSTPTLNVLTVQISTEMLSEENLRNNTNRTESVVTLHLTASTSLASFSKHLISGHCIFVRREVTPGKRGPQLIASQSPVPRTGLGSTGKSPKS